MRRAILCLALSGLVLVLVVPSAQANAPTITRGPYEVDSWIDVGCGFPVEVVTVGRLVHIEWIDEDGTLRAIETYPQAKQILTNILTGDSIQMSIAGPVPSYVRHPDGSFTFIGTGVWGWGYHPDTLEPGLFLTKGRWVWSVDSQGNQIYWDIVGSTVDMCPRLVG